MDGHVVRVYEDDESFDEILIDYIGGGLEAEEACIVVATPPHREGITEGLRARGLHTGTDPIDAERYMVVDAAETLSRFIVEGWPDEERFAETLGGLIGRAATVGNGRVRIFGEMVNLLFADAKPEAAIHLERLWNRLATTYSFTLLCAYPMRTFFMEEHRSSLGKICNEHTGICVAKEYGPPYVRKEKPLGKY